jgi:hypothetical protein
MSVENHSPTILLDSGIAAGAVFVPIWVYQISIIAGAIAAVLGVVVVSLRLMIAIRDWSSYKRKN